MKKLLLLKQSYCPLKWLAVIYFMGAKLLCKYEAQMLCAFWFCFLKESYLLQEIVHNTQWSKESSGRPINVLDLWGSSEFEVSFCIHVGLQFPTQHIQVFSISFLKCLGLNFAFASEYQVSRKQNLHVLTIRHLRCFLIINNKISMLE